jgi:prepilin-type processing-associated H-X9-DG protein
VSNGFGVTTQALVSDHIKVALDVAYADGHVTQTSTLAGSLYVRAGASLPVSPWNLTASVERDFPIRTNLTASLRVEDAFRSTPGSTYLNDRNSVLYDGQPDPSANILNVRAAITGSRFEVAAFLWNALNSHPLLHGSGSGVESGAGPSTQVVTLVPRTLSVSGTWRY